ncbi:hypothetical protein [Hyphomonas johnsonii]|uniref:Queuosine precursor transporter n=1 Tax=Hyphomonas johnsonii MHS-2 TaxID=1280950 RepID=A0A059FQL5_9PROT|nr:hypothetical protein [Hyphomonas johnsonii]KCZ92816.1 hypothetical protein HJO_07672 [Hyphomonas johnsonii MHS-2]
MFDSFISILTNGNPGLLLQVVVALALTFAAIYLLKGRSWALMYVALIPFLNWSFGVIPEFELVGKDATWTHGISLHPMTIITGMVFVIRDFVQREMGHRVLAVMAMAVAWSFFYAWPVIALASGIAFAISEGVDWLMFTFTKYRLSTRILLSSALAAPVDTTVFLYGADLAKQIEFGAEPGNSLHIANWVVFVIGKMVGAVAVSMIMRRREDLGQLDPAEA